MATKDELIQSVEKQNVKLVDLHFSHEGRKYTIPAALGVQVVHGAIFTSCNLKKKDVYTCKSGQVKKLRGQVSQRVWDAFNPPPPELERALKKLDEIEVPPGFELEVEGGQIYLVETGRRPRKPKP